MDIIKWAEFLQPRWLKINLKMKQALRDQKYINFNKTFLSTAKNDIAHKIKLRKASN